MFVDQSFGELARIRVFRRSKRSWECRNVLDKKQDLDKWLIIGDPGGESFSNPGRRGMKSLTTAGKKFRRRIVSQDSGIALISPKSMHKPNGYSHVAKVNTGNPVFIAGQVALDASGTIVGKDNFRAQAQQVFENLKAAVEAAGGSFRDIVKLNIYVVDNSGLPEYREVRDHYIDTKNPPASTAVQVAALFRPEFLIEVEAIAVVP
jgi:enamine deaminase RidA (YjgF/YER057c/UK114 family)